jgi:hypothetical protein
MTPLVVKVIWLIGVGGWFIICYLHERRAQQSRPRVRFDGDRR